MSMHAGDDGNFDAKQRVHSNGTRGRRGTITEVDSHQGPIRTPPAALRNWPRVAAALALLYLVLALPNHPGALTPGALTLFPLELVIIGAMLVLGARDQRLLPVVRVLVLLFLATSIVVKAADLALFSAFSRPFNVAYDWPLVHAGWMLFSGSSGVLVAAASLALASIAFCGLLCALWRATGVIARALPTRAVLVPVALLAATPLLLAFRADGLPAGTATTRVLADHVTAARDARRDIAALAREAAGDPAARLPRDRVLQLLKGKDIFLIFVESYGRSSLDNPLYGGTTRTALAAVEASLGAKGLAARSAWLTSPTSGGQSWLAHATLLSGLWIDTQGRYGALPGSQRATLNRIAAKAGWRSVAVMPAITMPWPEATYYGYDRLLAAADLGYRGLPFNWVTMPDQFTLAAFERLELQRRPRQPVFAEIALISSHAPWTPIPRLVAWEAIGDGTIFNAQARAGDTPETVWADKDRVRDQFRQSLDYALRTIAAFVERRAADAPLFVVLGDHQPASFVSGTADNRDVPVHIIGDAETIRRLDSWGWTEGMVPAPAAPVWRMDRFRDRFLSTFSPAPTQQKDPAA